MQCRRPQFNSWVEKIRWRRDRLPTPVFWGVPCGSAGKESACSAEDLGSIRGVGKNPWRRERLPTPVFWPGVFYGLYSPWDCKESDTTEGLSRSLSEEEPDKGAENISEITIAANFPSLEKQIVTQRQETKRVLHRMNPKRNTSR